MKPFRTNVQLGNPCDPSVPALVERATVDADSMHFRIPERVARRLGLGVAGQRGITDADGSRRPVPYVGPVEVRYMGRQCYAGAIVLGDEVMLGLLALEEMDLMEPIRMRALK